MFVVFANIRQKDHVLPGSATSEFKPMTFGSSQNISYRWDALDHTATSDSISNLTAAF